VAFNPSKLGSRLAALSITDNASGSPQAIALSGTATDFEVGSADGNTSATISAGQTATYHLQLSAENGFSGDVSVACSDSAPLSSCTSSQSGSMPVKGSAVPFTVQVSTTGPAAASGGTTSFWFPASGLPFLAFGMALMSFAGKTPCRLRFSAAILGLCVGFAGCGGGGSTSAPALKITPAGTYQITVNATSLGVIHPLVLTLKVQ
jgi:hypothetical protein